MVKLSLVSDSRRTIMDIQSTFRALTGPVLSLTLSEALDRSKSFALSNSYQCFCKLRGTSTSFSLEAKSESIKQHSLSLVADSIANFQQTLLLNPRYLSFPSERWITQLLVEASACTYPNRR